MRALIALARAHASEMEGAQLKGGYLQCGSSQLIGWSCADPVAAPARWARSA